MISVNLSINLPVYQSIYLPFCFLCYCHWLDLTALGHPFGTISLSHLRKRSRKQSRNALCKHNQAQAQQMLGWKWFFHSCDRDFGIFLEDSGGKGSNMRLIFVWEISWECSVPSLEKPRHHFMILYEIQTIVGPNNWWFWKWNTQTCQKLSQQEHASMK